MTYAVVSCQWRHQYLNARTLVSHREPEGDSEHVTRGTPAVFSHVHEINAKLSPTLNTWSYVAFATSEQLFYTANQKNDETNPKLSRSLKFRV
jgi:hypothetical protein